MLSPDLPLKLSAAGIRFTGYMIESNMRVARVFGIAALRASPVPSSMKRNSPSWKPRSRPVRRMPRGVAGRSAATPAKAPRRPRQTPRPRHLQRPNAPAPAKAEPPNR